MNNESLRGLVEGLSAEVESLESSFRDDYDAGRLAVYREMVVGLSVILNQPPAVQAAEGVGDFRVGDRVRWTNEFGRQFDGEVKQAHMQYTVQLDDGCIGDHCTNNDLTMLSAAPAAPVADPKFSPAALIVRDACELEPANPDASDAICVYAEDLLEIATRHTEAAPALDVDEAMVERAARGMWASAPRGACWEVVHPASQDDWRKLGRAALTAALGREVGGNG